MFAAASRSPPDKSPCGCSRSTLWTTGTRPRTLRLVFKSEDGKTLSDAKILRFESVEADDRLREQLITLIFNRDADAYSGKKILRNLFLSRL